MNGYIKLHRKMLEWGWYDDPPTKDVFLHLLFTANWQEKVWHGITIGIGQTWTSIASLADQTGLTVKQVRRALDNLEKTGEIAREGQTKGTLITVVNYALYQLSESEQGKQRANKGQAEGKQRATPKESNKDNKEINNNAFAETCQRIIGYLNEKAGTSYKPNAKYIKEHIQARLNDGYTEADFFKVIDNQTAKWLGTDMEQYLSPDTLFRPSKFDKYLNAPNTIAKEQKKKADEKQNALTEQFRQVESRLLTLRQTYNNSDVRKRIEIKADLDWLEDEYDRLSKLVGVK